MWLTFYPPSTLRCCGWPVVPSPPMPLNDQKEIRWVPFLTTTQEQTRSAPSTNGHMEGKITLHQTMTKLWQRFVLPDVLVVYLAHLLVAHIIFTHSVIVFIVTNPFHSDDGVSSRRIKTSVDASTWKYLAIYFQHRQDSGKGLFELTFSSLQRFLCILFCVSCAKSFISLSWS